jgi:hypothetical protein
MWASVRGEYAAGLDVEMPSTEKPDLMRPVLTLPLLDVASAGSAEQVVPRAPPAGITNRVGRRYPAPVTAGA